MPTTTFHVLFGIREGEKLPVLLWISAARQDSFLLYLKARMEVIFQGLERKVLILWISGSSPLWSQGKSGRGLRLCISWSEVGEVFCKHKLNKTTRLWITVYLLSTVSKFYSTCKVRYVLGPVIEVTLSCGYSVILGCVPNQLGLTVPFKTMSRMVWNVKLSIFLFWNEVCLCHRIGPHFLFFY